jgi:hypothetical protein
MAPPCQNAAAALVTIRMPAPFPDRSSGTGPALRARNPDLVPPEGGHMPDLDIALKDAMQIEGSIGAALVDYTSGMALGVAGGNRDLDLTVAAAGNTDVIRAKMRTIELLNLNERIEDILITLDTQYHLIRPITGRSGSGLFLYLALNKDRANLALARRQLQQIEVNLDV